MTSETQENKLLNKNNIIYDNICSDDSEYSEVKNEPYEIIFNNYHISTSGGIFNINNNKKLKGSIKNGYLFVTLTINKIAKCFLIHRLVAFAFLDLDIDNPKQLVNHKNGIKTDNRVGNLELCTPSENSIHSHKNGLIKQYTRPIEQHSKDGKILIKTFKSIKEAADELKLQMTHITKVCKGKRKTSGGFIFKYIGEYNEIVIEDEEWKQFRESKYSISTHGRVRGQNGDILRQQEYDRRYSIGICLSPDNHKTMLVHRLVAETFIPNPDNLPEVYHIDQNPSNNKVDNLRWINHLENSRHSFNKKVNQLDLNDNIIKEWTSITEAEKLLNIHNIGEVCNNQRNTAGGYKWKYVV